MRRRREGGSVEEKMMKFIEDCAEADALGYGIADPHKNGEYLCLEHFLNDSKKSEMVVYDVGANDGEWTLMALALGPRNTSVHAFEPASTPYQELVRRISKPEFSERVFPNGCGLDAHDGCRLLYVAQAKEPNQQHASHPSSVYLENVQQHEDADVVEQPYTKFITLDYYAGFRSPHIDYLKIDTEGMELQVLKGSEQTLASRSIDIIQFEYGPKYPAAKATLWQVFNLLRYYDFQLHRIFPEGLIHTAEWRDELECNKFSNYIALRRR